MGDCEVKMIIYSLCSWEHCSLDVWKTQPVYCVQGVLSEAAVLFLFVCVLICIKKIKKKSSGDSRRKSNFRKSWVTRCERTLVTGNCCVLKMLHIYDRKNHRWLLLLLLLLLLRYVVFIWFQKHLDYFKDYNTCNKLTLQLFFHLKLLEDTNANTTFNFQFKIKMVLLKYLNEF